MLAVELKFSVYVYTICYIASRHMLFSTYYCVRWVQFCTVVVKI